MPYSSKKTGKNEVTVYKKDSGKVVGHTTPDKYNAYMAALHIHSGGKAAKGGLVSPYPEQEQQLEEEGTKGSTDESNDPEFEEMPHLADGDILGSPDTDFGVDTGDSDTVKGLPLNPAAIPPQTPAAQPPAPPMAAPPKPPIAPAAAPAAPRMPGMPAGVTPDMLQQYLNQQRAQVNRYSPDQQYALEQAMLKSRTGLGGSLASAGATFADGIMQGVARAGNPGFAKAQEEKAQDIENQATGAMERARKGSMEQVEANQKIDMMDPQSIMSKVYQGAFAPIFAKMGYDPKSVAAMPASQINTVADLGVRYADAQTQLELKKAMLQVQTLTAQATIQNQKQQREEDVRKLGVEHPLQRLLGVIPSTGTVAGGGGGASFTPDVLNYAKTHNITPDQAQAIKLKRTQNQ